MLADEAVKTIIQIIPATGWYAILDEGTADEWKYPLVCWALTSTGEVVGQIVTDLGVESAEAGGNFSRYWHEKTLPVPDPPPTAEELAARRACEEEQVAAAMRELGE